MVKPISIFKKICIMGDTKVGKTSIVNKYTANEFTEEYTPSIGTKVSRKNVEIEDPSGVLQGLNVNLMIWDLLGSRDHAMLHRTYYAGAEGGIIVTDATKEVTKDQIEFWVKNFKAVVPKRAPVIIAINKVDAIDPDKKREDIRSVREVCRDLNVSHIEVSARTGESVDVLFYTISENMIEARPF
jgi:small GTP-binding protein